MLTHTTLYTTGILSALVSIAFALFFCIAIYNPALIQNGVLVGVVVFFLAFFITGVCFIFTAYDNSIRGR